MAGFSTFSRACDGGEDAWSAAHKVLSDSYKEAIALTNSRISLYGHLLVDHMADQIHLIHNP